MRTNSPGHSRESSFGKARLEADRRGELVDLVIDQQELAARELLAPSWS
jgi:hypothetical protein